METWDLRIKREITMVRENTLDTMWAISLIGDDIPSQQKSMKMV